MAPDDGDLETANALRVLAAQVRTNLAARGRSGLLGVAARPSPRLVPSAAPAAPADAASAARADGASAARADGASAARGPAASAPADDGVVPEALGPATDG